MKEEDLRSNAKELEAKVKVAHPELIMNMDETALDCTKATRKEKVVSTTNCPRPYVSDRAESHITFVPTVGITGWYLPTMVIVKSKTIVSDLNVRYGFPKSHWAHITSSFSACINQELFHYYVDEILIPGVAARRRMLNLPEDTKALLVLDDCLAHNEQKLKEIAGKYAIDYHFLIPHSSHITQALDRGFFAYFKQKFKTIQNRDTENKVGRRMMRGLSAMTQTSNPQLIRSSFWKAGMELNYELNPRGCCECRNLVDPAKPPSY